MLYSLRMSLIDRNTFHQLCIYFKHRYWLHTCPRCPGGIPRCFPEPPDVAIAEVSPFQPYIVVGDCSMTCHLFYYRIGRIESC